jgi:hypothetical protein
MALDSEPHRCKIVAEELALKMKFTAIVTTVMVLSAGAWGRALTPEVEDSLHLIQPRMRAHWLKERGIDYPGLTSPFYPESLNMTCVGRWSYGPAYDIKGTINGPDTILFLARGSGVSVLQFHGGPHPTVSLLSDINCVGLAFDEDVQDSWLYVGGSANGAEIYDVARPASPIRAGAINAPVAGLAVRDSFLYAVSGDSFMIFNVADRAHPSLVVACQDSGSCVAVAGNTAYLGQRWGLYLLDISNPKNPHRVGSWGTDVISVAARGNLCYVNTGSFYILDCSNPASPQELSQLSVSGWDMYLMGDYVCTPFLALLDVSDSLEPGIVSTCSLDDGSGMATPYGVWATGLTGYAFAALLSGGMAIVDLSDPVHPVRDTTGILAYDAAFDVSVDGTRAVVADWAQGARFLNVADPAHPFEIAAWDTSQEFDKCDAARLRGSLGYIGWMGWNYWRGLYVVSLADTGGPVLLGSVSSFGPIEAMVLRDSFLYCAEEARFQVLSIMDSARPSVVSTCTLDYYAPVNDLCLNDSIAYVANISNLRMIDVADPHNAVPMAIYTPPDGQNVYCAAVQDTIAYVGTDIDLRTIDVANPRAPVQLGAFSTQFIVQGVQVKGNRVVIGNILRMLDVSDPTNPREIGLYVPPTQTFKICWADDSLIYATDLDGGLIIVKYTGPDACAERPSGVTRMGPTLVVAPNPTTGLCRVRLVPSQAKPYAFRLYDSAGRLIRLITEGGNNGENLDLRELSSGAYFLRVAENKQNVMTRIVLIKGSPGSRDEDRAASDRRDR